MTDRMKGWYIKGQCDLIRDRCSMIEEALEWNSLPSIKRTIASIMVSIQKNEDDALGVQTQLKQKKD